MILISALDYVSSEAREGHKVVSSTMMVILRSKRWQHTCSKTHRLIGNDDWYIIPS